MADGRPRITVTSASARTARRRRWWSAGARASTDVAHQGSLAGERLAREVTERRVERRVEPPPPPVEAAVETVSAAEVLANVAEYGPNYLLPRARRTSRLQHFLLSQHYLCSQDHLRSQHYFSCQHCYVEPAFF